MSYTTISSFQLQGDWPSNYGTSGTLGIFCTSDFVADDGKAFQAGDGSSLTSQFVTKAAITVSANVATVASFSLPKTDLASPNTIRYFGVIFKATGSPTDDYTFTDFHLRASLGNSINYLAWWNDNQQTYRPQLDTYPTTNQMNTAISAAVNAPASTTQLGIVKVDTTPVDTAHPEAVGTNSYASTTHRGIGKVDVAPTNTTDPVFVGTNSPLVTFQLNVAAAPYSASTSNTATQNRTAIQAALDAIPSSGGTVLIPDFYQVSGSVRPKANTVIMGVGYGSGLYCPDAGWLLVAQVNMGIIDVYNVNNVRITNLRIRGTKTASDANHTPKLIYFETIDGLTIDHNWLENSNYEGIWNGGTQANNTNVIIESNHVDDVGVSGNVPAIQFNAEQGVIANNRLFNTGTAIGASGARVSIEGNFIKTFTTVGIGTGDGERGGILAVVANTVEFDAASGTRTGYLADGGSGAKHLVNFTGNVCRVVGTSLLTSGKCYRAANVGDVLFSSNTAEIQVAGTGFQIEPGSTLNTTLIGNVVKVVSEGAASYGFIGRTGGQTLKANSSNNKVYGLTRANGSYAFDYQVNGGGSLSVAVEGDVTAEGNVRYGDNIYSSGELDNRPISENSDLTINTSYDRSPTVGMLNLFTSQSVAIASGVITISGTSANSYKRRTRISVDVESGAADDLDTISGGVDGDIVILQSVDDGRDVTIKNNTGNIRCGSDFVLATRYDRIVLQYDSGLSKWVKISASTN